MFIIHSESEATFLTVIKDKWMNWIRLAQQQHSVTHYA